MSYRIPVVKSPLGEGGRAHPLHPPPRSAPEEKKLSQEGALGAQIVVKLTYY